MTKGLALISGAVLMASIGAAHAAELYEGAQPMGAADLGQATGKVAVADSAAVAANANVTLLQANAQGLGVAGIGACSKCEGENRNSTSQSAAGDSSATANNPNTAIENINLGAASGLQF